MNWDGYRALVLPIVSAIFGLLDFARYRIYKEYCEYCHYSP